MTGPRPVEERISLWLEEEAPGQLPDRVLESTFARTRALRDRPGPSIWRLFPMSRPVSTLLAVGAAAIVIVVGFNAMRPPSAPALVGASSSPSLSPSTVVVSPTVSATPFRSLKPLGLAFVGVDGAVRQDLGLPQDAWSAGLSHDGKRVAFTTWSTSVGDCSGCGSTPLLAVFDTGHTTGVYVSSGTEALDLGSISQPAWSPDGSKLAFRASNEIFNVDIYVTALVPDGPTLRAVTRRLTTDPAVDEFPAWSPDGTTILYDNGGTTALDDSGFSPTQEIWSVPAEGGTPRRLTTNENADAQPDISANGTVAYWHGGDIWTMTLSGKQQRQLGAVPGGLGFNPRWSPDGKQMAVHVYDPSERATFLRAGSIEDGPLLKVVIVDLATGKVSEVGARVVSDNNPVSWTPDGSSLLINRYDDGS
jgi:Tol biopolymer transport system component